MAPLLRNFLYLDDRLTLQYLAQLEEGVYDEEERTSTSGKSRSGEAGASVGPLNARGARGRRVEESTSRTVRQTPESNFLRLEKLLDEEDGLQWLEAFDDDIWNKLDRGEGLRIEAKLEVPSIYIVSTLAASSGPLVELMTAIGQPPDEEAEEAISGMTQINQALKDVTVIARASGAPRFKFICPLKRDFLREDVNALSGECVVVGSLQRRLKTTERYSLLDSLGLSGLPRQQRRKAEQDMKKDMPDSVVSAPAALLTTVAIYR